MKTEKIFTTIASHKTEYENPIKLVKGEHVKLGKRAPEENWRDWIWAESSNHEGGWVPIQLIDSSEDESSGVILENYSAKELNIEKGDSVVKIRALNGWTWVRRMSDNSEGWIPNETIEDVNNS
jgi:hypothetical protein